VYTVERYHDISVGHRVVGHENKCRYLHGHNYRVHFTCIPDPGRDLDHIGRVIDFAVVKSILCQWLEDNWDHKFLLWEDDPFLDFLFFNEIVLDDIVQDSVVAVPFNPTAENMAKHLVNKIGPLLLDRTGVRLLRVRVDETRKCSATFTRTDSL